MGSILEIVSFDGVNLTRKELGQKDEEAKTFNVRTDYSKISMTVSDFSSNRNAEAFEYLLSLGWRHFDNYPSPLEEKIHPETKDYLTELLDMLKKVESGESEVKSYDYEGRLYIDMNSDNEDDAARIIDGLACGALISSNGRCNWTNIKKVEGAGYRVFAGEQDSFGWLTGCISTKKGIIVYG